MTYPPWDALPADAKLRIRREMMKLLADLGIAPKVNIDTGELIVSLDEIADKLGTPIDEARRMVGPGVAVPPGRKVGTVQ